MDLSISVTPGQLEYETHLLPGDTSKLHRSLDLIQNLVLLDDIVDILHETCGDSSGITGVGVESLDYFLDCHGSMAGSPSIVVGRSTDEGVAVGQPYV